MYQELDTTGKSSKFKLIYIKNMKQKVTNSNLYDTYMPYLLSKRFPKLQPFSL